MNYCSYYQALVDKPYCWYVVAILKSSDHLAFDRTLDTPTNRFEFYVPADREKEFLDLMRYFEEERLVSDLKKLPNRLRDSSQEV